MSWINENWLWIIIAVAFFAMLFSIRRGHGHGGQGGHGGHGCCGGHDDQAEKTPRSLETHAHKH